MRRGKNIITILDIGSSKITCIVIKKIYMNNFEVLGISENMSKGIKSGMIVNLDLAQSSIIKSIKDVEKIALVTVKNVFVSLNSSCLISERSTTDIILSTQEVTIKDLNRMLFKVLSRFNKQEVQIIHTFPYEYILDGNRGIIHPLSLCGDKLTGFFHIVSVPLNYIANFSKCLEVCNLKIQGYVCSGYAAGLSCLTTEEKEFGCALIDIGGASSTISIFFNEKIIFTDGVPYGGINITRDIAKIFNLDIKIAEKLKNIHGSMIRSLSHLPSQTIGVDHEDKTNNKVLINHNNLNEVIIARMQEILILLKSKIEDNGMTELVNKIVITGGCASSVGIKELTENIFVIKSRIGIPNNHEEILTKFLKSKFTVPIGMIKCLSDMGYSRNTLLEDKKSIFQSILMWLKDNF